MEGNWRRFAGAFRQERWPEVVVMSASGGRCYVKNSVKQMSFSDLHSIHRYLCVYLSQHLYEEYLLESIISFKSLISFNSRLSDLEADFVVDPL
ncbi:hypothetical protein QVD17_38061 [Tagetes erecta]|uniref:Uncharacterized protein n=1 Tax=Tagetes erecta TaxID=13708 RepID=A0AAD8NJS7_TARER|nr:hypothetical protein QVD17_38061 [Tagetes erecta]